MPTGQLLMEHKPAASLASKNVLNKPETACDKHIKSIGDLSNLTAKLKKASDNLS